MLETPLANDRRRYFRINDEVGINYRVLEAEELDGRVARHGPQSQFTERLEACDERISDLLLKLGDRDPLMAEVLDAMDRKLQYVVQQLQLENRMTQQLAYRVHQVSISACGLAVVLQEPLEQNAVLELQLSLLPTERRVKCHGVVVEIEMLAGDAGYNTRIDFCDMAPRDQEILIQHIVQRQSQMLGDVRARLSL